MRGLWVEFIQCLSTEAPRSCSQRGTLSLDGVNFGEGAACSRSLRGEAAAGLEGLAVRDSSAWLHVGQSGNLGPAMFFLSVRVAPAGPRHPDTACFARLSSQRALVVATPVARLDPVELSGGQPALSAPVWPVSASEPASEPFDQPVDVC